MICTRCNDAKEVWDEVDKAYYPCLSCAPSGQEDDGDTPIEQRCLGPVHQEAVRLYAAILGGIAARPSTRDEDFTCEKRAHWMATAITDAIALRNMIAEYQKRKKKEPPK